MRLGVDTDGIYQVTYEQLKAAGSDLRGVRPDWIAITNMGTPTPRWIATRGRRFGPGSVIQFHGQARDSLYGNTNVYQLTLKRGLVEEVEVESGEPDDDESPVGSYLATIEVDNNRQYGLASPNGDPWYDARLLARGSPVSVDRELIIDGLAAGGGDATLSVGLWGVTNWMVTPDHHVTVSLNGTGLADEEFDGLTSVPIEVKVPAGLLQEGSNTVTVTLPGDTGVEAEVVNLDSVGLTFPRRFIAQDGSLTFEGSGGTYRVDNLPSDEVVVYCHDDGKMERLEDVKIQPGANGYSATFEGSGNGATYIVAATSALRTPEIQPTPRRQNITSGSAQYLIIAHEDFIEGIEPLAQARRAEGWSVRVVDVAQVYERFNYGIVDPQAIRRYISHAAKRMRTEAVLLVGGDTYDYFDYLGLGSISFIPTIYAATGPTVNFVPADPLFTDIDGNGIPNMPIGRLPVRTTQQLAAVVAKTLRYPSAPHARSAVFAADRRDGPTNFSSLSDEFIEQLPSDWTAERVYIDELGAVEARSTLLGILNSGTALTSFLGHSGPTLWTADNLLSSTDAENLTNHDRPTVVTQWAVGIRISSHRNMVRPGQHPGRQVLAQRRARRGGRAGSCDLELHGVRAESERELATRVFSRLFQSGMTLGEAVQQAKAELARVNPNLLDVLIGWTLLGDPLIRLQP